MTLQSQDDVTMPYSEYEIIGTVVDSFTGEPIRGVSVTLLEALQNKDGSVSQGSRIDSLEVNINGEFELSGRSYRGLNDCKYIRVTDLDPSIDGDYDTKMFRISLEFDAEPPANAHWSEGGYANRDVVLSVESRTDEQ